jgi:hypothetical protein
MGGEAKASGEGQGGSDALSGDEDQVFRLGTNQSPHHLVRFSYT